MQCLFSATLLQRLVARAEYFLSGTVTLEINKQGW